MSRSGGNISLVGGLLYLVVVILALIGWAMNIGTVVGTSFSPLTGEAVVRVIGILVFPVGAIMGWL